MLEKNQQVTTYLLKWSESNKRLYPWRASSDPYTILIAEFLLQKTPAERVNSLFNQFVEDYPTINSLANADPNSLAIEYSQLGLKKRFKWMVDSMNEILLRFNGIIPSNKKNLLQLPGIGEYTASAFLSFAHNYDIEIIDANVARFYTRIFGISKDQVKDYAPKLIPPNNSKRYNQALLDFASIVCKKKPVCSKCELVSICTYYSDSQ